MTRTRLVGAIALALSISSVASAEPGDVTKVSLRYFTPDGLGSKTGDVHEVVMKPSNGRWTIRLDGKKFRDASDDEVRDLFWAVRATRSQLSPVIADDKGPITGQQFVAAVERSGEPLAELRGDGDEASNRVGPLFRALGLPLNDAVPPPPRRSVSGPFSARVEVGKDASGREEIRLRDVVFDPAANVDRTPVGRPLLDPKGVHVVPSDHPLAGLLRNLDGQTIRGDGVVGTGARSVARLRSIGGALAKPATALHAEPDSFSRVLPAPRAGSPLRITGTADGWLRTDGGWVWANGVSVIAKAFEPPATIADPTRRIGIAGALSR